MENIKNLKQAKELVKKYRNLTAGHLRASPGIFAYEKLRSLSGFGDRTKCTLCRPVKEGPIIKCSECIYSRLQVLPYEETDTFCLNRASYETYAAINNASSVEYLLEAVNARADFIEKLLNEIPCEE